ncbi:hypothetical protein GUJ93_ZPchr0009g1498 [Zizania palustris]|uniref:Uncharacterized protein n=1 Tax=Zizania palustris TaxID=103762 RepID=A0A8J5R158_ZIZPA|nr:hypothetical protein GUJ93_ZPchr0009g1498 [Zizania palustris]
MDMKMADEFKALLAGDEGSRMGTEASVQDGAEVAPMVEDNPGQAEIENVPSNQAVAPVMGEGRVETEEAQVLAPDEVIVAVVEEILWDQNGDSRGVNRHLDTFFRM